MLCFFSVTSPSTVIWYTQQATSVFFFIGQFGYIFVCIQVSYVLPLFVCFVNNVNNVLAIGNSRIANIL
jgi:hypothetical protein